jgi:hypothetical protein
MGKQILLRWIDEGMQNVINNETINPKTVLHVKEGCEMYSLSDHRQTP